MDNGIFDYSFYGKTVFRPRHCWSNCPRKDLVAFDPASDMVKLDAGLVIISSTTEVIASRIKQIIIEYWDCFCARVVRCTILDYEFSIDTGASPPLCFRRPSYGPHVNP